MWAVLADAAPLQRPVWTRARMEAYERETGARFRVVYGTIDPRTAGELRARARVLAERMFGGDSTRVSADAATTEAMLAQGPVALLGGPRENRWTAQLAGALPVQFTAAGFRWQGSAYERPGDVLALAWPNPLAPKHFLLLMAANAGGAPPRHGIGLRDEDWRITRGGELARSGTFAQTEAAPWRYDAARDRDREAERARYAATLVARGGGALVVRAPAGLAPAADAARRGEALLARMDAAGLPAPPRARVTLTLYPSLERKGLFTRVTRPEHRGAKGEAHAALAAGRERLDLWSVAAARLDQLGASGESRFVEPAAAWLCGALEGEPLEAAVSRAYFARALPTAERAATRSPEWRSPLVWTPARALLVRALWESAAPAQRRAALLAIVRRDPPGTLESLCTAAGLRPASVSARYRTLADSLARAGRAAAMRGAPRAWRAADGFMGGVCLAHAVSLEGGYLSAACVGQLREVKAMGARWVSLSPFAYLSDPAVPVLSPSADGGPEEESDEAVCEAAARAKALGLRVWLRPQLWSHVWTGELRFDAAGWNAFFDRYEELALHYALLAQREGMDGFAVGHELASATARDPQRWRALIGDVRAAYSGTLTYDANWDEAVRVPFWDALDVIAVSFYAPLATAPTRDARTLAAGAKRALEPYRALGARFGKPVFFAELGYAATAGAPVRPWEETRESPDPATQRACYDAIVNAMDPAEWLAGALWWKWFSAPGVADGPGDGSFSMRGKPAEGVLRSALRMWERRAVR
ncbi:MAG: hypothetical protein U0704_04175 [Candidatus Eisenbacteria bacterium]